nr:Dihydrofolate reductase [uncultured bacterium]
MTISLVVAVSENGVIGKDNRLLWRLSDDLKRFKEITGGHHILMGRKTFESIGKPLPNRIHLIISGNYKTEHDNCFVFTSIPEAIQFAESREESELFIIGGGEIFKQTMQLADCIHLTIVHTEIEGDTFFEYDDSSWKVTQKEFVQADPKNEYNSTYLKLERQ